ncbi:MAG: hypothetical protein GY765_01435, partial [bacterium]|nr:hypothetical protein [bacterium]
MLKKITAAITVVIFTMMACSCTSIRREPISVFNKKSNNNARIDSLIKKSGVWVKFDQRTNPYIEDGAVKGYVSGNDGLSILTTIPLTDIKSVWVHRVNFGKSVVGLVVLGVSVLGAGFLALLLGNPFCPFVYSFNGRDYVFDAEPFAGAVSAGMERTELSILKHLQEVKGQYKLMLDNEVDARDCFNHLQLLVVDHAPDAQVIPGASGKIYTISNPLPPLQAYDQKGNDLLPLVKEMDDAVWHKGLERSEETGIKQSLVFRFPKPAHASSVTLIFKGSATL